MDFRGADFSGLFFFEFWALGSNFSDTRLRAVDMPAANISGSDFRSADLTDVIMPDGVVTDVDFSDARLSRGNLRELAASNAVFRGAHLAHAEIGGAFDESDLRGADLSHVRLMELDLHRAVLCGTTLTGAYGVVYGPFLADLEGAERLVGTTEAEQWFASRGAQVEVRERHRSTWT